MIDETHSHGIIHETIHDGETQEIFFSIFYDFVKNQKFIHQSTLMTSKDLSTRLQLLPRVVYGVYTECLPKIASLYCTTSFLMLHIQGGGHSQI